MQTSNEVTNIFKALCECKKDFLPLQKNKQGYGYKYVTLDAVIDMLNTVLPKHGLGFVQFPSIREGEYSLTTRILHESGEWMEDTITFSLTEISKANDTQKLGASVTYFRRYTLSAIFGIAADEDVDGNIDTALELQSMQRKNFNEKQQKQPSTQQNYQTDYKQKSFSKEKYSNMYLTTNESYNNELKQLSDEKYKNVFVFSDKTKSYINDKVDEGYFKTAEEYLTYIKRASVVNKRKIDSKIEEENKKIEEESTQAAQTQEQESEIMF